MAQNLFAYEDDTLAMPSRLKKKKKKVTNKKLFNKDIKKVSDSNDAGGYLFNDEIFNMDNLDEPSTTVLKPSGSAKKRANIRKKK